MTVKNILVDTSVSVCLLTTNSVPVKPQIKEQILSCHPYVIGEIAVGKLDNRHFVMDYLLGLYQINVAKQNDVLQFMVDYERYGAGFSYIDLHLLYPAINSPQTSLWTLDRKLLRFATRFGVAYQPDD